MSDKTSEPSTQPQKDEPDWKAIALHLMDCNAATLEDEGCMSRTSKSSRSRFKSICQMNLRAIKGIYTPFFPPSEETVSRRLQEAIDKANAIK